MAKALFAKGQKIPPSFREVQGWHCKERKRQALKQTGCSLPHAGNMIRLTMLKNMFFQSFNGTPSHDGTPKLPG
jgi:hypothetical protein